MAVATRAALPRLGNQAGLAHPLGQKRLAKYIVDFVCAGVIEVFPLEIDFRPAQIFRHLFWQNTAGMAAPHIHSKSSVSSRLKASSFL